MNFADIYTRAPINRQAAGVVSQRGASQSDAPLSREELIYILRRLERKSRLLKEVLGIKTKAQHTNLMWKTNKGIKNFRAAREPRALTEYRRVGREIQRMIGAISEIRAARKFSAMSPTKAGGMK